MPKMDNDSGNNNDYLSSKEAAELLGFSAVTMRRISARSDIQSHATPGGHRRYSRASIEEYALTQGIPIFGKVSSHKKHQEVSSQKLSMFRILIIDDDQEMVKSLRDFFTFSELPNQRKFSIESATNGILAGASVQSFKPDLVIMDIRMPGIDGIEACRQIRALSHGTDLKIILVSGHWNNDYRIDAAAVKADLCLEKPFSFIEVYRYIENVLSIEATK